MKKPLFILATLCLLVAGIACQNSDAEDTVRRVLSRTENANLVYQYKEETASVLIEVRGVIEDTFRHHEYLYIDGVEVAEQIMNDDSIAVKVLDLAAVPGGGAISADASQGEVVAALLRGEWVVDPFGAPSLARPPEGAATVGMNPMTDALNVISYFSQAIDAAAGVILFNPDSIDYRPKEDPFPRPNKEQGETRYDLVRPPLPRQDDQTLPGPAPFRRMSFYVKEGMLTKVSEDINISSHEDIKRAHQNGRPEYLLDMEKAVRAGEGTERVRERSMEWLVIQRGNVAISWPESFVTGKLGSLFTSTTPQSIEGT